MRKIFTFIKIAVCMVVMIALSLPNKSVARSSVYEVDGLFYEVYGTGADKSATLVSPPRSDEDTTLYSGDIVIPSGVLIDEEEYPVTNIGFFAFSGHEIKSIYLPKSLTWASEAAFSYVTLDSLSVPMDFSPQVGFLCDARVKKLIFRAESDSSYVNVGNGYLYQKFNNFVDTIEVNPCKGAFIGVFQGEIGCLHFRHLEEVWPNEYVFWYCKDPESPEYIVIDDEMPPVAMGPYADVTTIGGTLLFVPDGTETAYEAAPFWKTARGIYPQSRLPELETLLSTDAVRQVNTDSEKKIWTLNGRTISVGAVGEKYVLYDITGRHIVTLSESGEATLRPGIYLLSNGKLSEKIIVK